MIEFMAAIYFAVLGVLLVSDVARGFMDVALQQPPLKRAADLVSFWVSARLKEQAQKERERREIYGFQNNCSWERCESLVSSAGKAIAMK